MNLPDTANGPVLEAPDAVSIPVVDFPDSTMDTETGTLLELARPERKEVGGEVSLRLLLEIGTEEIPDWMIPSALENLRLSFEKLEIPHESVRLDATPRRLVLRAEGLPARQPDSVDRVLGPPKSAPPQAVAGFARKQGIQPDEMKVESTPKGEYYTYLKKVPGRNIIDILAEALPGVILGIYFPKTMYWTGKGGPRSSVPSAGSSPSSAKIPFPSNWPAYAPAPSPAAIAAWARARSPSPRRITNSASAITASSSPPKSAATASARGWRASASSPTTNCWKPWSISPNAPCPSRAASIRGSWNSPKRC